MLIALDLDGTYDRDPKMWNSFIKLVEDRGHEIICVTLRTIPPVVQFASTFCTAGEAKAKWCREHGLKVDIWIDDAPRGILVGALNDP